MSRERLSMRKIREVLRLRLGEGLGLRAVSAGCGVSCATVLEYARRAQAAGLCWPLPEELDDAALEARLFPPPPALGEGERPLPDWSWVHRELRRPGVTLQLLWQEYRAQHPQGFGYSWFCEQYRLMLKTLPLTLHQEHKAGEALFVDYAGQTMPVTNPYTGEQTQAVVFVAAQGASNYTFAEATWTQGLRDWLGSHVRAFAFFGGVNAAVVPDNTKSAVTSPCRYEPDINKSYLDLAQHYGCAVLPARAGKPRDKAKVEAAVQGVQRWVLAPLRDRKFFSLPELNEAIREQLEAYNTHPFQKLEGSRRSLFEALDKPALRPLPATSYEFAQWKQATVHVDYHVEVEGHRYSVPYQLVGKKVDARVAQSTVEVFHQGKRVASHPRSPHKGRFTTQTEHMPKAHQEYLDWTPERLIRWAHKIGADTGQLIEKILAARTHPQHGFRACLGIMRLGKQYGQERLEAAAKRALAINSLSYKSIESILKHRLDQQPLPQPAPSPPAVSHQNVRGPEYYQTCN